MKDLDIWEIRTQIEHAPRINNQSHTPERSFSQNQRVISRLDHHADDNERAQNLTSRAFARLFRRVFVHL
jgi:hypothetical protein